jgi:hypothetical protein
VIHEGAPLLIHLHGKYPVEMPEDMAFHEKADSPSEKKAQIYHRIGTYL